MKKYLLLSTIVLAGLGILLHGQSSMTSPPPSPQTLAQFGVSCGQGRALVANNVSITPFFLSNPTTFSHIAVEIATQDAVNLYSFGVTDTAGNVKAHTAAASTAGSSNIDERTLIEGTVTLQPGWYLLGITGNNATALFGMAGSLAITAYNTSTTSSAGAFPGSLTIGASSAGSAVGQLFGACFILR